MTSRHEVQTFLNDFFTKYRTFDIIFLDERKKNTLALLDLELTPAKRKQIIESIKVEDFSQGPLDDKLYGIASLWVFGKFVNKTEVYIKISLGRFDSKVICISFHRAEHPMRYPFK